MRLICPNCDAEYEVDASLIPEAGRDVQCSNCGHAWFQPSPEAEAEAADEEALFDAAVAPGSAPLLADADDEDADDPESALPLPAVARSLDASVLDVLRSEAERESRAREEEGSALESQVEMGLLGQAPGGESPYERISRLKDGAEAYTSAGIAGVAAAGAALSKSQILPEIDVINSTLRAKSEPRSGAGAVIVETMDPEPAKSGGFGRGFMLAAVVIMACAALYVTAPALAGRVPVMADTLTTYVSMIDGLRGVMDGAMRTVILQITSLMGGA